MKKRTKSKLLRAIGLRRCKKNRVSKQPLIDINDNRSASNTVYPPNWMEKIAFVCSDGTKIYYNPISNQKATDEALEKLKKDTILGKTNSEQYD